MRGCKGQRTAEKQQGIGCLFFWSPVVAVHFVSVVDSWRFLVRFCQSRKRLWQLSKLARDLFFLAGLAQSVLVCVPFREDWNVRGDITHVSYGAKRTSGFCPEAENFCL